MIQYVHVIFTPLLSVHKVGAWRLDEAVQKASVEEAAASSFPPKAGGLPRPLDYDDYWSEGEDGLWYNEYDDELEEGQYYEEVPEEDGYPKPDLTAVEAVDEEVVPDVIQPPTVARPEEKQQRQRKESQTDIDPDLRAAQEAAKAASDAAKNRRQDSTENRRWRIRSGRFRPGRNDGRRRTGGQAGHSDIFLQTEASDEEAGGRCGADCADS